MVADRYFELCVAAIKAADPNHLVLGSRFGALPHAGVVAAAGRHLDVISFNCYAFDPSPLIDAYAVTGKPCMITEFAFRGDDVGLPNSMGGGPRVADQIERAASFRALCARRGVEADAGRLSLVRACRPAARGRFDGEDCNYGTVNIEDDVYAELTDAISEVNAAAEWLHAGWDEAPSEA